MNLARFVKKCLTDPLAALVSAKLVVRSAYGFIYWKFRPGVPLIYHVPTGGRLRLTPGHSFTHAFWPGVDKYEPDVREALRYLLRPGHTFIDCGANIGYFSVMALGLVGPTGRVVAVEANPVTFELLRRNIELNGRGTPVHCAVTSHDGDVEIFVSDMGDVYSSLKVGGLVTGDTVHSHKVPGKTLDAVVATQKLDRVDVVKIDIEGAEMDALRSAPKLMAEQRPVFVVEYGTNTWPTFEATANDLLRLAGERGYRVRSFDPVARALVEPPPGTWESAYTNVLLVPNDAINAR
jgi:FkbM family methyltransferase